MWPQFTACQSCNYILLVNSLSHCPRLPFRTCSSLLESVLFLLLLILNSDLDSYFTEEVEKIRRNLNSLTNTSIRPSGILPMDFAFPSVMIDEQCIRS